MLKIAFLNAINCCVELIKQNKYIPRGTKGTRNFRHSDGFLDKQNSIYLHFDVVIANLSTNIPQMEFVIYYIGQF